MFYSTTIPYDARPLPYRSVRFVSGLTVYAIDGVEATTARPDSDGDGLPDTWESTYTLNPLSPTGTDGAAGDPDNDGLTNAQEYAGGTNPTVADTDVDQDGLPNGWENTHGLNPLSPSGQ